MLHESCLFGGCFDAFETIHDIESHKTIVPKVVHREASACRTTGIGEGSTFRGAGGGTGRRLRRRGESRARGGGRGGGGVRKRRVDISVGKR